MPEPAQGGTPTPTAQPVGNAPAAAGTLTPQEPSGEIEGGKIDMLSARKLTMRAITKFGVNSDEGKSALSILASMTKAFGEFEDESERFSDAEKKRILVALAGPGTTGGPPQQPTGAPGAGAPQPPPQ